MAGCCLGRRSPPGAVCCGRGRRSSSTSASSFCFSSSSSLPHAWAPHGRARACERSDARASPPPPPGLQEWRTSSASREGWRLRFAERRESLGECSVDRKLRGRKGRRVRVKEKLGVSFLGARLSLRSWGCGFERAREREGARFCCVLRLAAAAADAPPPRNEKNVVFTALSLSQWQELSKHLIAVPLQVVVVHPRHDQRRHRR